MWAWGPQAAICVTTIEATIAQIDFERRKSFSYLAL
jgi:hypothetical protein